MSAQEVLTKVTKVLKSNSPEIFTVLGITGVVATTYLTVKASFRAVEVLERKHQTDISNIPKRRENIKDVWKEYIPPVVAGAVTIGCIVGAKKVSGARTAAAVTAYSLTEKAFSEYKEKVVEHIGPGKEQKVIDAVAQDKVAKNPPAQGTQEVVIVAADNVLCCELFTRRFFRSNMDALKKAQNEINARINRDLYVALDELYDILDLPHTSNSNLIGWDSNKLLDLTFTTTLSDNGEPCLAFDYNYTKPLT